MHQRPHGLHHGYWMFVLPNVPPQIHAHSTLLQTIVDKLEHFKGRILRDDWVGQAKLLAAQPDVAQRPGAA